MPQERATDCAVADDYRRRARRLRSLYRDDPGELQPALHRLSRQADADSASCQSPACLTPHALFAQSVAQRLDVPILRYSERQALLDEGERCGVSRFEANLIIALAEHRRQRRLNSARVPARRLRHLRLPPWLFRATAAALIQSLILALAYAAFA